MALVRKRNRHLVPNFWQLTCEASSAWHSHSTGKTAFIQDGDYLPIFALTYSKCPLSQDIILPGVRTGACFPVTNVPSVASTVVRANIIAALCVHVTKRWRNGALVNVW